MMIARRISLPISDRLFELAFPLGKEIDANGERFRLHADHRRFVDHASLAWAAFGDAVRPVDIVVDVGSNIGLYTLAAARRVGPAGRVYALDPDSR